MAYRNNVPIPSQPQSPKAEYNESLVINSGFNLILSPGLYLTDLLRLEFHQELTLTLGELYLRHIIPPDSCLFTNSAEISSSYYEKTYVLLPNWKLLIINSGSSTVSLIEADKETNESEKDFDTILSSFDVRGPLEEIKLTGDFPQSFLLLSYVRMLIKHQNTFQYNNKENIEILANEITNFIYSISKIPAKKLLLNLQEAKDLFRLPTPKSDSEVLCFPIKVQNDSIPAFACRESTKPAHKKQSRSEGYIPKLKKSRKSSPSIRRVQTSGKYSIVVEDVSDKRKKVKYFSKKHLYLNPDIIDEANLKENGEKISIASLCYSEDSAPIRLTEEFGSNSEISYITESFEYTSSEDQSQSASINPDSFKFSLSDRLKSSLSMGGSLSSLNPNLNISNKNPFDLAESESVNQEDQEIIEIKPNRQVVYAQPLPNKNTEEAYISSEENEDAAKRVSTCPIPCKSSLNPIISFTSVEDEEKGLESSLKHHTNSGETMHSKTASNFIRLELDRESVCCSCKSCMIF